jgi:RHS repeat-associated protein
LGYKALTYQNFLFLEVVHQKKATTKFILGLYGDHLGNVRLSYSDTHNDGSVTSAEIKEENNYYPFGLEHKGYNNVVSSNSNSVARKFKFNGVELEKSLGLDLYEMEFRMYDPAIGRFNGIDPVVHYLQGTSVAFDNNPIFWADPSGADGEYYNWDTGQYENDQGEQVSFEDTMASVGLNSDGQSCDDCKLKGGNFDGQKFSEVKEGRVNSEYNPFRMEIQTKETKGQEEYDDQLENRILELEEMSGYLKSAAGFLGVSPAALTSATFGDLKTISAKKFLENLKNNWKGKIKSVFNINGKQAALATLGVILYTGHMAFQFDADQRSSIENNNAFERANSVHIIKHKTVHYINNHHVNRYSIYNAGDGTYIAGFSAFFD